MRLLLMTSIFILGCGLSKTPNELNQGDLIEWYNDFKDEFVHEKTIDEFTFKVEFIPHSVLILTEFQSIGSENKKEAISRDSQLSDYLACRITFSKSDPQRSFLSTEDYSPEEYASRLSYFISQVQKDIYLIDNGDTLKSHIYHFENTYGLERSNKAMVMFKKPEIGDGEFEFVFDDKVLGTGTIRFTQKKNNLTKAPRLII